MKKVLIVGGAGFIGSHLADRMLLDGHRVTIVDNLENGHLEFVPRAAATLYGDVGDPSTLRFISQSKFDLVYHLAAKPRVSYSVENPAASNDANLGRTVALLEACRGNCGRFVFTSSSSVYGGASILPTPETHPHDPKSPYALQKSVGEQYCAMFSDLYDMDTVSVRPFNVIGPRQLANGPYGTAVSSWLHAAKHGQKLRFDGDGSQTRDLTYVANVVDVMARLGAYSGKFRGEAFNAGTGTSTSNSDVLAWVKLHYPKVEVERASWRPGDVMATCADTNMARQHLGYVPLVDLKAGLELTREWAMSSELF